MTKIADFLKAGCSVTILFADLHAYLDNMKAPWELLTLRTKYYKAVIIATLRALNVPIEKLQFVTGTDYQLSREYSLDAYRLAAIVTEHDAKKAGAEVIKQVDSPLLSGLIYPGLQALDEEYLKVDAQFGGVDQRKIFVFAEKYLPHLGYKKRAHLMNVMVGGLSGSKMSSSDADSKIDLLDTKQDIERKLKKAFCEEGNVAENPILQFVKTVFLPVSELVNGKQVFEVKRPEKYGGNLAFETFEALEMAFKNKEVHPGDLKQAAAETLDSILAPIRETFAADKELQELAEKAYPKPKPKTVDDVSRLDIRVGLVQSVERHPEAEHLLIEKVDLGEENPRTIVSGLAKYYSPQDLVGKKVLVLANMKPSKFRGVNSEGMILAASIGEQVEILVAPESAKAGSPVVLEGFERTPDAVLNPKHKIVEKVKPEMKTNDACEATYKGVVFSVNGEPCLSTSLSNALIG